MKKEKRFEFEFPIMRQVYRDGRFQTEKVCELLVSGSGYDYGSDYDSSDPNDDRFSCDIDGIEFPGTNLELLNLDIDMDDVHEAAINHTAYIFSHEYKAGEAAAREDDKIGDSSLFETKFWERYNINGI